jgi:cold shock CspA family protein
VQIPLQITFRGVEPSDAVESAIRERADKLERYAGGRIIACRVIVQEPNRRHQQGDLFAISIDLTLPGAELAVGDCVRRDNQAHENIYVAIRDAFGAMERKLKDHLAIRRREMKTHVINKPFAKVTRIFPQDGYGFITTPEGREIYFHLNSVIDDAWIDLDVGSPVRFTEELGDQGPQATTVEFLGNRRGRAAAS